MVRVEEGSVAYLIFSVRAIVLSDHRATEWGFALSQGLTPDETFVQRMLETNLCPIYSQEVTDAGHVLSPIGRAPGSVALTS
jgi:hypothetical protein